MGAAEKRTAICNFVKNQNIDILFPTEACLTSQGDEAECRNMCPAGYSAKSFPRLSRGAGLAVIYRSSPHSYISVDDTFDFDYTAFELMYLKLSVSQCSVHFICLYPSHQQEEQTDRVCVLFIFSVCIPPTSKTNRLTESLFFDQLPDMLEFCTQLKESLLVIFR